MLYSTNEHDHTAYCQLPQAKDQLTAKRYDLLSHKLERDARQRGVVEVYPASRLRAQLECTSAVSSTRIDD